MSTVQTQSVATTNSFMQKVYGWMFGGLLISGTTAYFIGTSVAVYSALLQNNLLFYVIVIAQLLLVIALSAYIKRMSADVAIFLFLLYCLITGVTLSVIFLVYTAASISIAFFIAAGTFGAMSLYGMTTKTDLTSIGKMMIMALIGIIIASIVNIFLRSTGVDYVISIIGVIIFVALTAYDTQKLKTISATMGGEGETQTKVAVMGALALYLDFINMFLQMLKLFGKRK